MTEDSSHDAPFDAPDDSDPLARESVRDVVRRHHPDASLREVRRVEHGKNAVAEVTVEGGARHAGTDLVLKVGTRQGGPAVRAEPVVMEHVAERTAIPVPAVVGHGTAPSGDPYLLMERAAGQNHECDPAALAPETLERVCVEAGRNLGRLHAAFPADGASLPVEGFGLLGFEPGADRLQFEREFADWPALFEAIVTTNVDRLADTRFADLRPALEEHVADAVTTLRDYAPFEPVLTHGDYRLGNVLVADGETTAVLDWATPVIAPAAYELAVTEAILLDWPELDAERQRTLRECLLDGYRESTDLERDDEAAAERDDGVEPERRSGFEACRQCYRLAGRIRLLVNLDEEMQGRSEAAVDDRAAEHREALAAHGVT